jgi:hypothetical protein
LHVAQTGGLLWDSGRRHDSMSVATTGRGGWMELPGSVCCAVIVVVVLVQVNPTRPINRNEGRRVLVR